MENYKKEFIDFMVRCEVLKFGSFTLKSGRQSPFFMNAGAYVTGGQLAQLGKYYAQAIHNNFGDDIDVFAVGADDLTGNGQAQAGTFFILAAG